MINVVRQVETSIVILIVGSFVSLLLARRRRLCGWVSFAIVCVSSVSIWLAVVGAVTGPSHEHAILSVPQLGSRLALRVDPLSAIFLAIVALIALLSTLYSIRYMDHYVRDKRREVLPGPSPLRGQHDRRSGDHRLLVLPHLLGVHDADVILPGDV